jgi:hypothetical protein
MSKWWLVSKDINCNESELKFLGLKVEAIKFIAFLGHLKKLTFQMSQPCQVLVVNENCH